LDSDGELNSDDFSEILAIYNNIPNPGVDVPVFLVKKIKNAIAFVYTSGGVDRAIFVQENNTPAQFAQELGHRLGVPEPFDDEVDDTNLMSDPQLLSAGPFQPAHVRRKDWNATNP
jgi:hypothetical protein